MLHLWWLQMPKHLLVLYVLWCYNCDQLINSHNAAVICGCLCVHKGTKYYLTTKRRFYSREDFTNAHMLANFIEPFFCAYLPNIVQYRMY